MLSTLGLLASLAVGTFDLPNRATRRGRKTRGQLGQGNVSHIITKEEKEEYKKKWDEINKDKMKEYNKKYIKDNKEKKTEIDKEYYENNKEHIKSNVSKYRENNKDKIKEYQKEKITCECGCLIYRNNILRHKSTQKHVEIIKTLL